MLLFGSWKNTKDLSLYAIVELALRDTAAVDPEHKYQTKINHKVSLAWDFTFCPNPERMGGCICLVEIVVLPPISKRAIFRLTEKKHQVIRNITREPSIRDGTCRKDETLCPDIACQGTVSNAQGMKRAFPSYFCSPVLSHVHGYLARHRRS